MKQSSLSNTKFDKNPLPSTSKLSTNQSSRNRRSIRKRLKPLSRKTWKFIQVPSKSSIPFSINLENARHSNNISLRHRRITKSTTVSKILQQTSAVIISTKHTGWMTRFQRWNLGLPLLYDRESSRLGDRTGKS